MNKGCQSIYDENGNIIFQGEWNPKVLVEIIRTKDGGVNFWEGKRVLDIGSNTAGLSLELARLGAKVIASEPDPYKNTITLSKSLVEDCVSKEKLSLEFANEGLLGVRNLGKFDIIICFGLLYHFRYPMYILDYLSSMAPDYVFLSTQTHPTTITSKEPKSSIQKNLISRIISRIRNVQVNSAQEVSLPSLMMVNRREPNVMPKNFFQEDKNLSGWHITRPLLERMLLWAGFGEVISLTDKRYDFPSKMKGATNSAYYRAKLVESKKPEVEVGIYYPR